MSLNTEIIKQALTHVIDPELHKNLVDLGMVRDIQIDAGEVTVTLALTIMGCPLKDKIRQDTINAVSAIPGVDCVTVEITTMTAEERQRLKATLSPAHNMNRVGRIVVVMSGKGGVGKSSMTALLAIALQRQGLAVGVLDADVTGPSIPRMFGVRGPVRALPMGMVPIESNLGIKVISTNLMLKEEDMAVLWRGPIVSGTLQQFWRDVLWGRLDYLLVDLPPGTSDATQTILQNLPLDGVVMVTTPQSLASMVVRKTVRMCQHMQVPILGVVENMSYFICPQCDTRHTLFGTSHTAEVAGLANAPILGQLPLDPALADLADHGEIEQYASDAYSELARTFQEIVPTREPLPAAAQQGIG